MSFDRIMLLACSFLAGTAQAAIPARTAIRILPVQPGKLVARIETTRVDFAPGQIMPAHKHLTPVVCFVASGSFVVSIADDPVRTVPTGDVTIEPAGAIVHYFRNASTTAPATLLCATLAGEQDTVLNVMLDPPVGR